MSRRVVRVLSVEAGGKAAAAGLRVGDLVDSVDGAPVADSLDFEMLASEPAVCLRVERGGELLDFRLEREWGEGLGLRVGHRPRACRLRCRFCFVEQQPAGTRRSLCLKDDDYALSFRDGNFVTLSNLDDEDYERIVSVGLSPLYVSVHATDPAVRARLLRPRGPLGRDVLPVIEALVEDDIVVHAQIVLVPGENDGACLERSLADLCALAPGLRSLAVVPVGLTRYQRDATLRGWRPEEARALLAQLVPWQERMSRAHGYPLVMPSDEWFLLAGAQFPPAVDYDGFPQIENGVGLCRQLLDELASPRDGGSTRPRRGERVVIATGRLAAPLMERAARLLAHLTGAQVEVKAVESAYWGPSVTVVGLLTAEDLAAGLSEVEAEHLLLPDLLRNDEGRFLDDHDLDWLAARLRTRPRLVTPTFEGMLVALR